ncbi:MAG TPA: integrase [Pseudonocardiaceae bacterium]
MKRRTAGQAGVIPAQTQTRADRERDLAGQLWTEGGWVFTTLTSGALNPRTDYDEWKRLLPRAGIRDAGSTMPGTRRPRSSSLLGVPERAVIGIMDWSNSAMAARYQPITAAIQRDVAQRD